MNVPITVLEMPQSKYWQKCPYAMQGKGVVFHNTDDSANSAMAWASQRINSNAESSIHMFVDEDQAVNCSPLDRNTWHAMDGGQGYANRNLWSIEVCRSRSPLDTFLKAERNAAWIVALLFVENGLEANTSTIRWHYEFAATACPHRTKELGLGRIIPMVQAYMAEIRAEEEADMSVFLKLEAHENGKNNQMFDMPGGKMLFEKNQVPAGLYPVLEFPVVGSAPVVVNGEASRWYCTILDGKKVYGVVEGLAKEKARILSAEEAAALYGSPLQIGGNGVPQADYDAVVKKVADAEQKATAAMADAQAQKQRADAAEFEWKAIDKELGATIARADSAENNAAAADQARQEVQARFDAADGAMQALREVFG